MEIKPGYKLTDVGVIPGEWEVKSLAEIGDIRTGPFGTLLKAHEYYASEGVPLVSVRDIREGELTFDEQTPLVPAAVVRRLPQYVLKSGDIVFGRKGGVERSAMVRFEQAGCFLGSDAIRIRLSKGFHAPFITHQLQRQDVRTWLLQNSTGTTMASMNQAILRRVSIPQPKEAEQRAIAEALSDVDELLGALEALVAKKRDMNQAAMQQLLTGKTRLGGFSGTWERKKIIEIASLCGERNSPAKDLPVLTCSKHLGFIDSLSYFKNQVFSKNLSGYKIIRRGQIGYPANHIEEGSIGLQDLYDVALVSPIYVVFEPAFGVSSYFLHRLLKLDSYQQIFANATNSSVDRRGSLRWPAFSEITIELPPNNEQERIAKVLSDMDAEIGALEARRAKTRAIKQGMMQQLLTGRIRLVKPQPAEAKA